MLSFEWQELEAVVERLNKLRHEYAAAYRRRHHGLVETLRNDIDKARRQRDQLIHHISARLGAHPPTDHPPDAR